MGSVTQISLRSKRKSGYSWVDNEIASCYQAIIGPDAAWVYHNLAQQVQEQDREPSVTFALRDMAGWTGRSADTVRRSLAVLELVGLIAVQRGTKAKARYDLIDVKELVLTHGGVYDVRKSSFVLPASSVDTLKAAVKDLRTRLARKVQPGAGGLTVMPGAPAESVAQSDRFSAENTRFESPESEKAGFSAPESANEGITELKSVAHSDRLPVDNIFLSNAGSDSFVAQEHTSVALGAAATSYRKKVRRKEKSKNPLPPQKMRGMGALNETCSSDDTDEKAPKPQGQECGLEAAIDQVMFGCGFVRPRIRKTLRDVLLHDADLGTPFATTALAMTAAWKKQVLQGDLLRARHGPDKFFGDGHWRDSRGWHWNTEAIKDLHALAGARVGSYNQ